MAKQKLKQMSFPQRVYNFARKRILQIVYLLDRRIKNEVFCMSPWLQLHAQTNGMVAPCCMASTDDGNKLADLNENPNLNEAWNSERMKALRLAMLSGKKSDICKLCYKYESLGNESERMKYNKDYTHLYDRVLRTQKDGSLLNEHILLLDMRFSNKCNYKCRICDSSYSSLWYEDEQKLGKKPQLPSSKKMTISSEKQSFEESFYNSLGHLKKIHFAGGEPLVMDEHYQVLEYLVQKNHSEVVITYNTNFSTLKYKNYNVVQMWNNFQLVDIWASLDGMFAKGDYMRKGQRWDKIEENIRTVQKECTNVLFGINITVSILNIFHLPEFITYLINNKLVHPDRINLYLLFKPLYYNLTQLPPHVKIKATETLNDFKRNFVQKLKTKNHLAQHIDYLINYMNAEQGKELREARYWLNKVDELRGESFVQTFPELAELMEMKAKN